MARCYIVALHAIGNGQVLRCYIGCYRKWPGVTLLHWTWMLSAEEALKAVSAVQDRGLELTSEIQGLLGL